MQRREKTEFILEQMRLLVAVARQKDAEAQKKEGKDLGGGEAEWVKVRVGGRKVNEEFLKEKDNEVLGFHGTYTESLIIVPGPEIEILRSHDSTRAAP